MSWTSRSGGALRKSSVFAFVDIVGKVLALVAAALLARKLDTRTFGTVLTGIAAATILSTIFDCGINQRLVAVLVEGAEQARAMVTRRYHIVLPALIVALFVSRLAPDVRFFAQVGTAGLVMSLLPVGPLLADGKVTTAALALIGPNILFLGVLLVSPPLSAVAVIALWAFANLTVVAGVALTTPWLRPVRAPEITLHETIRQSAPLGLTNAVAAAYGRVDIILVAAFIGAAAAGAYAANYRIVLALIGLASWTCNIEARRLGDPASTTETLRRLLRWAVTASVLAALALAALLPLLVRVVLSPGQALPRSTSVLLALLVVPHVVAMPLTQLAILRHRQRDLARAMIIVGASAILLYPGLILEWGVTGAALASLLLETLGVALFARVVARLSVADKSQASLG